MKLIWVTGANGFLGRNLCRYLSGQNFHVVGIGHGYWKPGESEKWGISQWFFSDINLPALNVLESNVGKPYAIFQAAGSGSVPLSIKNPYLDYQRTAGTTLDVLEYIRLRSPDTRIIYPSSAAVYGATAQGKIPEEASLSPVSPYGTHKEVAELLCKSYAENFSVKASVIRLFSLYGNGLTKQLLWDLCRRLEEEDKEIILHGTGDEIRDWIHINDAVKLMAIAMDKASSSHFPVNGGTGIVTTVKEVALEVCKAFGNTQRIVFNGVCREGDPRFYQADTKRAESWGWIPAEDWKSGVRAYVKWFKEIRGHL